MRNPTQCPRCGTPLLNDTQEGLCPRCLMEMVFASETQPGVGLAHETRPPLPLAKELASYFPQLEIREVLGRGGMGVVYRARQKSLDRWVALKIIAPELAARPEFAVSFAREANALARLSHPNIVTVHDFGETGGLFFLLMEYVDGVNLRQAMQAGRLAPEQALAIVPPVCEALDYAHQQGVVHCDIKPENILLDKLGRVKIGDFGVAKMLGQAEEAAAPTSHAAGTPRYMAPEQQASPETVDHRADIYSLGVVLYEMLTGEVPKQGLVFPSQHVRVDVRIDEIVLRALHTKPELRYHSAQDFKAQVEHLSPHPRPTPPKVLPKARKGVRIFRALALLLLTVICILTGWHARRQEVYLSKVTMEVQPPASLLRKRPGWWQPIDFQKEAQLLRSSAVVQPVVEQLQLTRELAPNARAISAEEAASRVRRAMVVQDIQNTNLIELGFHHREAQLAAQIANALALQYRRVKLEDLQQTRQRKLAPFQEAVERQRVSFEKARQSMSEEQSRLGVNDPAPEGPGLPSDLQPGQAHYAAVKEQFLKTKRVLEDAERRLSSARGEFNIDGEPVKIWQSAVPSTVAARQ